MISVAEALDRLFALASPLPAETVPLANGAGRVLAANVLSRMTQPPFASSAMDGYAVRNVDAQPGMSLKVIGESAAGARFPGTLGTGEAVRIFTGAPVPDGADAILIQEDADRKGNTITVRENRDTATYIRPAGGDFAMGDPLTAPRRLSPVDLSLLASMNIPDMPVTRRPVVALIATGNELVMPGETPSPDQIIASNSFALKALLEAHGAECRMLPIAKDTPESLRQVLDLATGADLIVTLGGASVGDYDIVQDVAVERGLSVDFYKVAMQPGKPLMAGKLGDTPMVGLPGNPVSSIVCGHVFLRPMLDVMLGLPARPLQREIGVLGEDIEPNGMREQYLRAVGTLTEKGWQIVPFKRQDSSLLSVLSAANVLMVRRPDEPARQAGDPVEFIRISS